MKGGVFVIYSIYIDNYVKNVVLSDGIFSINFQNNATNNVLHVHGGSTCFVINKVPSILWHRRLEHICFRRIKRLVNDGVLRTLDFTDFETCVNYIKVIYIKGKQTNKYKKCAKRSYEILEIIRLLSRHGHSRSKIIHLFH